MFNINYKLFTLRICIVKTYKAKKHVEAVRICIQGNLKKSVEFQPKIISYLLGIHAITTKRLETMEKAGYSLVKLHLCKVWRWYGMSALVVWKKCDGEGIIKYDRKLWGYNKLLNMKKSK